MGKKKASKKGPVPANADSARKLILHTCCGPCASGCVELLAENGRETVLYFSNSNLADRAEYERRLAAAQTLADAFGLNLIADPYDHEAWLEAVSALPGYEEAPERGDRCRLCFAFSLNRAAKAAAELDSNFATSLTVSPHKNSAVIFGIGEQWNSFEPWDFKKQDGFKKSLANAAKLNLYRQDFCGCEFSRRDRANIS